MEEWKTYVLGLTRAVVGCVKAVVSHALSPELLLEDGLLEGAVDYFFDQVDVDKTQTLNLDELMATGTQWKDSFTQQLFLMVTGHLRTGNDSSTSDDAAHEPNEEPSISAGGPLAQTQRRFRAMINELMGSLMLQMMMPDDDTIADEDKGVITRDQFTESAVPALLHFFDFLLDPAPGALVPWALDTFTKNEGTFKMFFQTCNDNVKRVLHEDDGAVLIDVSNSIFDLFDAQGTSTLSLSEIKNVSSICFAKSDSSVADRFRAFIGLFDVDRDGVISKSEVKITLSKVVAVVRSVIQFVLEVAATALEDALITPLIDAYFKVMCPNGLTPEFIAGNVGPLASEKMDILLGNSQTCMVWANDSDRKDKIDAVIRIALKDSTFPKLEAAVQIAEALKISSAVIEVAKQKLEELAQETEDRPPTESPP